MACAYFFKHNFGKQLEYYLHRQYNLDLTGYLFLWGKGLVATRMKVLPGETVEVEGKILSGCQGFEVNIGKDCESLLLHFNPRFNCKGDTNVIVCNSKREGTWGEEQRESHFPFEQDSNVKVSFTFDTSEIKVKLTDGHEFSFPNRIGLDSIEYIAVDGDFKINILKFR